STATPTRRAPANSPARCASWGAFGLVEGRGPTQSSGGVLLEPPPDAAPTAGGGSSNGRTADSDSASLGSNPSPPASADSKTERKSRSRTSGERREPWTQFAPKGNCGPEPSHSALVNPARYVLDANTLRNDNESDGG